MLQSVLMKSLIFATGNAEKFLTAKHACDLSGLALEQRDVEVSEIQSEDPEKVALDKARKAFDIVRQPVVITDDSWAFSGLRGFPGVYMHSINEWFRSEDFLRLVLPLEDRGVTLTQYLVYIDGSGPKVFTRQTVGTLLKETRGTSKHPSHTVITLSGDDGLSIAEAFERTSDKSTRRSALVWHDFVAWYLEKPTAEVKRTGL
jgi:inosine/xanthosine triphosphate pyrophosphatase family protein